MDNNKEYFDNEMIRYFETSLFGYSEELFDRYQLMSDEMKIKFYGFIAHMVGICVMSNLAEKNSIH